MMFGLILFGIYIYYMLKLIKWHKHNKLLVPRKPSVNLDSVVGKSQLKELTHLAKKIIPLYHEGEVK